MIPIARPMTGEEEAAAAGDVIRSGMLAQGPVVKQFEEEFAAFCGTRHAIATSSGTTALHAALIAAKIGRGDTVVVPAFTFFATASAVAMTGATPLFADVDERTFNIDPVSAEQILQPSTRAIIGVHLFGHPFDVRSLQNICEDNNLFLIEDAAQAHGAMYDGKKVGSFGDMACFSFYPTKNMTTGEGGMVTTQDDAFATTIRMLINHGQSEKYLHPMLGYNYRMTDIAGAIGRVQLGKLDHFNEVRIRNAALLTRQISSIGLITPTVKEGVTHVYHQYVVRVPPPFPLNRDALVKYLTSKGIGTAVHYPLPLSRQPYFKREKSPDACPISERLASEVLSLPVHPLVTEEDILKIGAAIREVT